MRLAAFLRARSFPLAALAIGSTAILSAGCAIDVSQVFNAGAGGQGGKTSTATSGTGATGASGGTGGVGASGGTGGVGASGGTGGVGASGGTGGVGASGGTGGVGASTTTTTTSTGGVVCGDGKCDMAAGESSQTCPKDCPGGACDHGLCEWSQTPLQNGCDACVTSVCAQHPKCCTDQWDGECIAATNELCNNLCCGDGACLAEQCDSCVADCGHCPPDPTCPHSVCNGSDNAAPLNTASCFDPCIDEVCAVIDSDTDNCCTPEPPAWSSECTNKAHTLCPEYGCIKDVCAAMPSCCSTHWTKACVTQAQNTPSCATQCNCAHDPCAAPGQNSPLAKGCNPCVDAVCGADPYCCDQNWDGLCVSEVGTLCGIVCN